MDVKEKLLTILKEGFVCDNCLGRQFGQLLSGFSNEERGKILRFYAGMLVDSGEDVKIDQSNLYGLKFHNIKIGVKKHGKCYICGDIFNDIKKGVEPILKELKRYEFDTFLIGTKLPGKLMLKEQKLWEKVGVDWCETLRSEINRILGKEVEKLTKKRMDRLMPDIVVLYDLETGKVELNVRSIYIYGKYQKLVRNIPQTTWKRRVYPVAVQDIIAKPFMMQTRAEAHRLHGAGREDVDVRCLGWRPFVLELIKPRKRGIKLTEGRKMINKSKKVKVKDLKIVDRKMVTRVKSIKPDKVYRCVVEFEKPLENLEEIKKLENSIIVQQTPRRVLGRRVDTTRKKKIKEIKYRVLGKKRLEIVVRTQAGTYVKELIHGDNGRTNPNIQDLINNKVKSIKLDVIKICD
ncbi:MAG: tRNA pseudouridine(54/55) synthase Pus10 [Candidatus Aenigmatarchaeota archaeon]